MGFISRKVLPACGNMCVCCPALRPSSRQPVKRYKKLLGEIFPKNLDGPPNERKIIKLCEYAARNPFRIPKIAKFLEQRSYKELRCEHINFIKIIMETYSKLLCICKEQMAYFAASLLNVIIELLNDKRQDSVRIIGCQTLTTFIYSQADSMYAHNIESLMNKICALAREEGEDHSKRCLRAASLECLSAAVWFMSTFSYIFTDFDEVVHVILDNYGIDDAYSNGGDEGQGSNHNWVEVVKSDVRGTTGVGNDFSPKNTCLRQQPDIKESSVMTREESENPKIWAQICIQKIVQMAKESTTMRCILDPMFTYFDTGKHWDPQRGLAMIVLSDMSYLVKSSGDDHVILAAIIRHLDHKNVVHDPQMKSDIIQVAAGLIQQLKSQNGVAEIGIISDLCRHLRKSLQATVELAGLQEANWNLSLQNSIEDCLLEISKGVTDAQPLFDIMTITLEELPAVGIVARATIGSLLILAHIISSSSINSHSVVGCVFPESLFLQLLKTMMHPDVETRIGAHRIFSVLLIRTASQRRNDGVYIQPEYMYEPRRWQSRTASAFESATALLEKLRREKESVSVEKVPGDAREEFKESEMIDEEWEHGRTRKNSPNFYKLSCSIIDRTACSTSSTEAEPNIVMLSDDQIAQLLSAFSIQSNQPDNLPSNFEAIAHSFSLTLLSARLKNSSHHNVVRIFQLPLSLQNVSLDPEGVISPSGQRSLFTLSTAMLMFGGKTYHIPEICKGLKSLISKEVDPYLSIGDDLQLYARPQADVKQYGSEADKKAAISSLATLRKAMGEINQYLLPVIVQSLSNITDLEVDSLVKQLSETFTPDDGLLFGPNSVLDWFHNRLVAHSDESLSLDEEFSRSSSVNGDILGESPTPDLPHFVSKMPTIPSTPHVISVGQLLESALHVAGQVAGTAVSTSPLPYGTMATQCEALGMGTRKKLSSWFSTNHDLIPDIQLPNLPMNNLAEIKKINAEPEQDDLANSDRWLALRLPPASPFDNFLKAARY